MMALLILSLSVLEDIVNLLLQLIGKGGTQLSTKQSREKKANYHIQTTQARKLSQSGLLSFQSLSYEYSYPIVRVININEGRAGISPIPGGKAYLASVEEERGELTDNISFPILQVQSFALAKPRKEIASARRLEAIFEQLSGIEVQKLPHLARKRRLFLLKTFYNRRVASKMIILEEGFFVSKYAIDAIVAVRYLVCQRCFD